MQGMDDQIKYNNCFNNIFKKPSMWVGKKQPGKLKNIITLL